LKAKLTGAQKYQARRLGLELVSIAGIAVYLLFRGIDRNHPFWSGDDEDEKFSIVITNVNDDTGRSNQLAYQYLMLPPVDAMVGTTADSVGLELDGIGRPNVRR
jgi:hypothetical protein